MPRSKVEDGDRAIARLIAQRRRELGLSQFQVAQKLGVSHQIFHRYEAGQVRVSVQKLIAISDLLKIDFVRFKEVAKGGGSPSLTPEDMAARRLGKIGRDLAQYPEALDALAAIGQALLSQVATPPKIVQGRRAA